MRSWIRAASLALLVGCGISSVAQAAEPAEVSPSPSSVPAAAAADAETDDDTSTARYTVRLSCNDSGTASTVWLYNDAGVLLGRTVISGLCYTGTIVLN